MSFGKGSNQTTSTQTPNPAAMAAYNNLLSQAGQVASTPYQAYGGEGVAGINAQQMLGINNINQNAGFANPYIQQATQYANQAAQPLTASQIQQYESPYTQDVINATQAQFNNQNAQQQSQVMGNAAAQGALGGNRAGVAQALTAGQQQMAQAPVIAGLQNQGYQTALSTAQQQQQNMGQAAYSLGNLGVAGQNAALTGANAQFGAGSAQQQTQQMLDQYLYGQYQQQQAYPYQQLSWLAGIDTGVGSNMGGTSQTTGPAPNFLAQLAGLGIAGAGMFAPGKSSARGGRIAGFARHHYDGGGGVGGMPWGGAQGWIPAMNITHGSGPPKPPNAPSQQQSKSSPGDLGNAAKGLGNIGNSVKGWFNQSGANPTPEGFGTTTGLNYDAAGNAIPTLDAGIMGPSLPEAADIGGAAIGEGAADAAAAGAAEGGTALADLLPLLLFAKRGGRIAGFAKGGAPDYGDLEGGIGLDAGAFNPEPNLGDFAFKGMDRTHKGDKVTARNFGDMYQNAEAALAPDNPDVSDIPADQAALPTREIASHPIAGLDAVEVPTGSLGIRPGSQGAPELPPESKQAGFGGFGLSDAARTGLIAAGLGMMASRSPFLGNAIGEGGLAGLSSYSGTKHEEATAKQVADKLKEHHDEVEKKLKLEGERNMRLKDEHDARERDRQLGMMKPMVIDKDGYGQPVYGRMDAKGNIFTMDGNPYTAQQKAKAEENANLKGDQYIETLPKNLQPQVRQAGQYMASIPSSNARSPEARQLRDAIFQAFPDIDERMYGAQSAAVRKFWSGPDASNIRSFNVSISHLDTLQNAANALQSGDIQLFNKLKNAYREATGSNLPTDFNAVRNIVSDEIVKAVVGAKGALGDREETKHSIDAAFSQGQFDSVINRYKELMAGQLRGYRQQFTGTTGLQPEVFDRFLMPETKQQLLSHTDAPAAAPVLQGQDKSALDWANANPNDPRAVAIKKKLGVQ